MPFTLSHVAAILPFARSPLPPAALAVGAMTPDLVFFVPFGPSRTLSHSPLGAVTLDPLLALVALALWWLLLRAPVLDLGPRGLRERMASRPHGLGTAESLRTLAAVLIGITTHLGWDWFTHRDALAAIWSPWAVQLGPLPLTSWLQYGSSLLGAGILALWARSWWRRTPADPARARVASAGEATISRIALPGVMVLAAVAAAGVHAAHGFPGGLPMLLFRTVVTPIAAGLAALVVISVVWWVRRTQPSASRIRS